VPAEKGGQDIFGAYDVVAGWPKKLSTNPGHEGWTFGAGQSVFAESPDRVYVVQRGELPEIPRPQTKKLSDLGPSIAFPIGRLAAPNLTRGKGGVGGRLDAASAERAIRHGLGEDGRLLLYMPTTDFNALTDADTADLIAYVLAIAPVDRDIPAPAAGPLMRTLFVLDKAPLVYALRVDQHAAHTATMAPAATAEYGRYLANGCAGCHGEHFSGGRVPGTPPSFPPARNITPDPGNGIGKWSKAEFDAALRSGKRPDGSTLNTFMPWKAFARLTDIEVDALWAYLQTVPARATSEH